MKMLKAKKIDSETRAAPVFSEHPGQRRKNRKVIYPESDGKPMADNTKQYRWIVKIKENLERIFADDPNVFIAGDLLWYPVEGNNKIRTAPDVMVAFGRPKRDRGSYRTWDENNVSPQVVFEILSPGNRKAEMEKKLKFYEKYGVQEYYVYDPDHVRLTGRIRSGNKLVMIENMQGWASPLLKIRFNIGKDDLHIFDDKGEEFLTPLEFAKQYEAKFQEAARLAKEADIRAKAEQQKAKAERQKAKAERQRAEAERREKERLAAKLRDLGFSPDQL